MKFLTSKKYLASLALVVFALVLISQFQNCSSSQSSGTGLTLGSSAPANPFSGPLPGTPSAIAANLIPPTVSGVAGSAFTFSVSASGGSGNYSYAWNIGSGTGSCLTTSSVCAVSFPVAGNFSVAVTVSDTSASVTPVSASSSVALSAVIQPLLVSLSPLNDTVSTGVQKSFTASASGGQGPYNYIWTTPMASAISCSGTSTCVVQYVVAALTSVQVDVSDSAGRTASASTQLNVTATVVPPQPTDNPPGPVRNTSDLGCDFGTDTWFVFTSPTTGVLHYLSQQSCSTPYNRTTPYIWDGSAWVISGPATSTGGAHRRCQEAC